MKNESNMPRPATPKIAVNREVPKLTVDFVPDDGGSKPQRSIPVTEEDYKRWKGYNDLWMSERDMVEDPEHRGKFWIRRDSVAEEAFQDVAQIMGVSVDEAAGHLMLHGMRLVMRSEGINFPEDAEDVKAREFFEEAARRLEQRRIQQAFL